MVVCGACVACGFNMYHNRSVMRLWKLANLGLLGQEVIVAFLIKSGEKFTYCTS